jgi:hypothetical protein
VKRKKRKELKVKHDSRYVEGVIDVEREREKKKKKKAVHERKREKKNFIIIFFISIYYI